MNIDFLTPRSIIVNTNAAMRTMIIMSIFAPIYT
jgi:hypothetical protein